MSVIINKISTLPKNQAKFCRNTFFWSLTDKQALEKLSFNDVPFYQELKNQNYFILDLKYIEGGLIARAFKTDKDAQKFSIQINEVESGKLVKNIELNCDYHSMIPLPASRLIIFSQDTQIELWDFKTLKCISQKIELNFDSHVIVLSNNYLVTEAEKLKSKQSDASYRCTSIWQISENEIKLKKKTEHNSKYEVDTLWLREFGETQFMIFLDGCIEVWDIDGKLIKSFKIFEDVKKQEMVKLEMFNKFIIIETYFLNKSDLGECVVIFCSDTGRALKQFNKSFFLGFTPFEIFIQPENEDSGEFCINVHAIDDNFKFLGTLNTENFYHDRIRYIDFDSKFSLFSFKDFRYLPFVVAVKKLDVECNITLFI